MPVQSPTTHALAVAYLLFSHVLWPIYVPAAVMMIEPLAARRRHLILPVSAGAAAGIFYLAMLLTTPVSATIKGQHIGYHILHPYHAIALTLYLTGTCVAPLLSSYKTIRMFGIAIVISLLATYVAYSHWFVSVWCFFAALMSGLVFLHFARRRTDEVETSVARSA